LGCRDADRAFVVVLDEIQAIAAELERNRAGNQTLLAGVIAADRAAEIPDDFNLTLEYSLISISGWETARMTQATHFMPIERVQGLSQLCGLQGLYPSAQDTVLTFIFDVGAVARDDPNKIPSMVRGPLSQAVMMDQLPGQASDRLLIKIEWDRGNGEK
jgi:hypothetical protein